MNGFGADANIERGRRVRDIVDIPGVSRSVAGGEEGTRSRAVDRPWLAIKWKCCGSYSRIYRNLKQTAYVGNCPKCAKRVEVKIGEGGTPNRFFEAE